MNTDTKPISLLHDISMRFTCGTFCEEKVILCRCPLPTKAEGMFFRDENLIRKEPFHVSLIFGDRIIGAKSDTLPVDWQNPLNVASAGYDKLDKGAFQHIPWIGPVIESVLPDARWRQALWYQLVIGETGRCEYKIHIGPPENIERRNKFEGTCQL
jgi:hypothetical protein